MLGNIVLWLVLNLRARASSSFQRLNEDHTETLGPSSRDRTAISISCFNARVRPGNRKPPNNSLERTRPAGIGSMNED